MDHEWRRQREDYARLAPMGHVLNRVGTQQKKEHGFGQLFAELAECVDRKAQPSTIDFER